MSTDPDGSSSLTCYDSDGNITQTVPPAGVAANNLTAASCPSSYPSGYGSRLAADATTYTFDAAGQNTSMTSPAPAGQSGYETTTASYNADGMPVQIKEPPAANGGQDQVTDYTYNADENVLTETTGAGTSAASTISYCYDPDGAQTAVVAPDGNTDGTAPCNTDSSYPWIVDPKAYPGQAAFQTTNSYDSTGELVSTTSPPTAAAPDGGTTTFTYDADGDLLTTTDPDGVKATDTYTTAGGNVASVSYSGSSAHSVNYTYDAEGNMTGMTDATGTSSFTYDPFGELTSTTDGAGQTVSYAYDADGDTTGITYPLPASATWPTTDTVSYGYDKADDMTSVTDFNGHQITITPDADGLPSSETLGSTNDTISYTYDQTDAPSAITLKNSSSTLQSFTYADAPDGDVLSETDVPTSSKSPVSYSFDPQGRVISMTAGSGSPLDYGFDASGNLTTLPNGASATYDDDGELTSSTASGTTTNYTYNADGERLAAKQSSATVASGTWNGAAQLTSYSDPAADMTNATYDGSGLRTSETTGSGTQNFVWGGGTQLLMDSTNAYIYTDGVAPAEQVNLSTGTISYLNTDALGSVRGIVSSSGALTASTAYDAWGNPETSGGLTSDTPFGYAGGYTDPTGLIYLINRYYDPSTGQFLSVDPAVSQTGEPYAYAGGDPVDSTDPDGLWQVGIPSDQSPGSDELYFQNNFVAKLLGEGRLATTQYQVRFTGRRKYPDRYIDVYFRAGGFGFINELKVGRVSLKTNNIASEATRDRYMIRNFEQGYCHPDGEGGCKHFPVDGGVWWFRYHSTNGCQYTDFNLCAAPNLRRNLLKGRPRINIIYVFYNQETGTYAHLYDSREGREEIRKALESNDCPNAALDNIGLPTYKFPKDPAQPYTCSNDPTQPYAGG